MDKKDLTLGQNLRCFLTLSMQLLVLDMPLTTPVGAHRMLFLAVL